MKKQIKYLAFGLTAVSITLFLLDFCTGKNEDETAYYNNPDIISNRLQQENAEELESGVKLYENTKIAFAGVEEAQKILTVKDQYFNSQTAFDRRIRMNSTKPVTEKEYLDFWR